MCGIAGILAPTGDHQRDQLPLMLRMLEHRGPDATGIWHDQRCALGHQRLAIIDLSERGRQPLSNEDGTLWLSFNGEIYNFQALRRELEDCGHRFRSHTDSEVIVHAYEEWDLKCLDRFRGMFAFAVWDQRRRRLFLARDRVGEKPLFYTQVRGYFLFASELQGLLAHPEIEKTVDLAALDAYLSWGYIPAPRSGFQNIFKLPPAHWLTAESRGEQLVFQTERYWKLEYEPKWNITEQEAREELRTKLAEAVRLRMISDVSLGAFLSGGIDSSVVVALMAQQAASPVKTFSIGFDEQPYNELPYAGRIADKWKTDHHEFIVKPNALEVLPQLVHHYGEPYADSSALPTYYLCRMTRQHVTVALNGDGGDESFAGYERYLGTRLAEGLTGHGLGPLASLVSRLLPDAGERHCRGLRRFLAAVALPLSARYGRWLTYFNDENKSQLYADDLRAQRRDADRSWWDTLFVHAVHLDAVDAVMAADVESYLPYDLLVKMDIASMANGLEVRSPLLDHEVMEFSARLPVSLKLRGWQSKYLVKQAFGDLLPQENVNRRKMGFGVPIGDWLRGPLRGLLQDTVLSDRSLRRGYFKPAAVRTLAGEHLRGHSDHAFQLWNLLMLEVWHQEFLDR